MSKRKINTTKYLEKGDIIFWRIHFVFILNTPFQISALQKPEVDTKNAEKPFTVDDSLLRISVNEVAENIALNSIINSFSSTSPDNATLRHMLNGLRKSKSIRIFMQKLPCMAGAPLYIELNGNAPIKECLSGRTIIEYPTIIVGTIENTSCISFFISDAGVNEEEDSEISLIPSSTISPSFAAISIAKAENEVCGAAFSDSDSEDNGNDTNVAVNSFIDAFTEVAGKDTDSLRQLIDDEE